MFNDKTYSQKMDKTFEVFTKELASLRTGRANSNMLDLIKVEVYGQKMPINQLGTITTPEPRTINIQVWDLNNVTLIDSAIKKSDLGLNPHRTINIQVWDLNNVTLIDSAIKKSDLGLNPQIDGQLIRLPIPDLSEERRNEMKKIIKTIGEKCRVSIRNIRREANDQLKTMLKSKDISEDDEKKFEKIVQKYTDDHVKKIDDKVVSKEKEIMTI